MRIFKKSGDYKCFICKKVIDKPMTLIPIRTSLTDVHSVVAHIDCIDLSVFLSIDQQFIGMILKPDQKLDLKDLFKI